MRSKCKHRGDLKPRPTKCCRLVGSTDKRQRTQPTGAVGKGNCCYCLVSIMISKGPGCPRRLPQGLGPRRGGCGRGRTGRVAFKPTGPLCAALNCHLLKTNLGCISGFPFQPPGGGAPVSVELRTKNFLPIGGPGCGPTEGQRVPNGAAESPSLSASMPRGRGRWHQEGCSRTRLLGGQAVLIPWASC